MHTLFSVVWIVLDVVLLVLFVRALYGSLKTEKELHKSYLDLFRLLRDQLSLLEERDNRLQTRLELLEKSLGKEYVEPTMTEAKYVTKK